MRATSRPARQERRRSETRGRRAGAVAFSQRCTAHCTALAQPGGFALLFWLDGEVHVTDFCRDVQETPCSCTAVRDILLNNGWRESASITDQNTNRHDP